MFYNYDTITVRIIVRHFVNATPELIVVNAAFLFFETSKLWALIMYIS